MSEPRKKKSMSDFIRIHEQGFYLRFGPGKHFDIFDWHPDSRQEPEDIDWWDAHIDFLINKGTGETVGFRRTSSWNNEIEYWRIRNPGEEDLPGWKPEGDV